VLTLAKGSDATAQIAVNGPQFRIGAKPIYPGADFIDIGSCPNFTMLVRTIFNDIEDIISGSF
jgi:hypothetical protein